MRTPQKLATAVAAVALATAAAAAPAHASNGWGWGQLPLDGQSAADVAGIRATLLASIPAGITQARLDALAPLVKGGALTKDQAQLIASVHNASVVSALRKSGQITASTAVAVRKALAGTNGSPAKIAAANIALDRLVSAGLITPQEAELIRAQLALP